VLAAALLASSFGTGYFSAGHARTMPAAAAGRPALSPAGAVYRVLGSDGPPRRLTPAELDAAAVQAGWPRIPGWWPEMRRIITAHECPSLNTRCLNIRDPNGGSFGLAQLNGRQHFETCGEDYTQRYDPVVNLRTALCLRAQRGRFGGPGGWAGADALGID
jgi:hypothetical protein